MIGAVRVICEEADMTNIVLYPIVEKYQPSQLLQAVAETKHRPRPGDCWQDFLPGGEKKSKPKGKVFCQRSADEQCSC